MPENQKGLTLYLANYGLIINTDSNDLTHLITEEIYAENDEEATKKAENLREVLDLLKQMGINSPKILSEVIILSITNQANKRKIYSCGYCE